MAIEFLSIQEAERLAGKRLDRRRKYFLFDVRSDRDNPDVQVCYQVWWTQGCSGCAEWDGYSQSPPVGAGCDECGYTGKRRYSWPVRHDE